MQGLVATQRGALIDLAWKAPDFDPATRQLVGFELFRDDMSTRPPLRRTWKTMPVDSLEARGLEILPHSEYGVQPIWRMYAPQPPYVIAFGPPRLSKDVAGPSIVVPPDERIHSLASLQRQGLITTEEMKLAVDELLGRSAPPAPEPMPTPKAAIPGAAAGGATPAKTRRLVFAYIATAVVLVFAVVVAGPWAGRLLFAHPSAVQILPAASPTAQQPSPSPSPPAKQLNLRSILIKSSDLRPGYVTGQYQAADLCATCVPALYSLSVGINNVQLHRGLTAAASVAPSIDDGRSVVRALTAFVSSAKWVSGKGLGDESFLLTITQQGRNHFYVVWRTGAITEEIVLIAPIGSVTMQSAIDLAKIQQARTAKAVA